MNKIRMLILMAVISAMSYAQPDSNGKGGGGGGGGGSGGCNGNGNCHGNKAPIDDDIFIYLIILAGAATIVYSSYENFK